MAIEFQWAMSEVSWGSGWEMLKERHPPIKINQCNYGGGGNVRKNESRVIGNPYIINII